MRAGQPVCFYDNDFLRGNHAPCNIAAVHRFSKSALFDMPNLTATGLRQNCAMLSATAISKTEKGSADKPVHAHLRHFNLINNYVNKILIMYF